MAPPETLTEAPGEADSGVTLTCGRSGTAMLMGAAGLRGWIDVALPSVVYQ
jgi:hypothetical protein